jgi:hypothetical protein
MCGGSKRATARGWSWSAGEASPEARGSPESSPISPSGTIGDSSPVYSWKVVKADEYQFWLDGLGKLLQPWLSPAPSARDHVLIQGRLDALHRRTASRSEDETGSGREWSAKRAFSTAAHRYPGATTLVSPKGTISISLPTYTWNRLSSSTEYYLWINSSSGNIFKQWYPSTATLCPGTTCSVKPDLPLEKGAYTWWIQTKNSTGEGLWSQALSMTVQATDTTAPTVALSAPTAGASVSGTVSVIASASDNVGVKGVQFQLNGQNLGAEDLTAPFAVSWNTTTTSNSTHTLTARARDAAGNQKTSSAVTVTAQNKDTTPPTVSIVAPAAGSTVSGTIFISANASDNVGVTAYNSGWMVRISEPRTC